MHTLRALLTGIATLSLALALTPHFAKAQESKAQDFPARPVRIVVAFPPGGPTDFVGRLVADKMSSLLGQRVYIDNKPGANGTLGGGDVAKSDPDGYSLFLTTSGAVTVSPHIMPNMPFDTFRDFAPVALVTTVNEVLVVSPKLGVKNVKELVALAKKKPGAITFASTGVGSPPHLAQLLLDAAAGVKFLHVPYRGAAPALTDLLGGQVQVVALDIPVVISQIQAGTLVPIGIAGDKRDAVLPDVPTLAEQGYPNTNAANWYALLAPAKTPSAVIAKLNKAVNEALADPALHDKLVKTGATPAGGTPEALGTFMKSQYDRWGHVIAANGIKAE
ncbi:MAG TPA: tripartite tricarboxylate transporter substrate binding protein [Xanthobacteraceae bacterium]|nr:tripartite tricarboxylate transporter substrate binding protein [Xanthobacteraceae bacterium]